MSSQGTGSIQPAGFDYQLLVAWGDWARGDISLGFVGPGLWKKNSKGQLMFSDDDLCQADAAIARLPRMHKANLKQWFIRGQGHKIDEQKRQAALNAFSESLAGACAESW